MTRGLLGSCSDSGKGASVFLLLLLSCIFTFSSIAQAVENDIVYSKIRIYATSAGQMRTLNDAGLVFDHIQQMQRGFETVLNNSEIELLVKSGIRFKVLVRDMEAQFRQRRKLSKRALAGLDREMRASYDVPTGFEFGSMAGFYTNSEVIAQLDEMFANFPNLITAKQSIGTSIEGRDIWMVKISDNPNVDENEEEVLYTGLMHAREPMGMTANIYFMFYILENYGVDPTITFLIDNRELYFIPVINPDGYIYNETTNPNGGGMWRKNRRNNGSNFGVDINRNFDYQWGYDNNGSSPNPGSSTYRGTAPASEPETQAVQNFANSRFLTMTFNYHSYANSYNFPWGYKPNFFTPDHAQFVAYSQQASLFSGYRYGTPWSNLGYVTNGYSNDWFYGEQSTKGKVFSWTVEVGRNSDGFWPNQSRIIPLAEENIYGNIVLAWGTGGAPNPFDLTFTPINPPVTVPSSGGQFQFDVEIANSSGTELNFKYWTYATRVTTGGATDALKGPFSATLASGDKITQSFTQVTPAVDPDVFNYILAVGTQNLSIINSTSFQLTVVAGPSTPGLAKSDAGEPWVFNNGGETPVLSKATTDMTPGTVMLNANYPNPFNPSTNITYQLPQSGQVRIVVYDLLGRTVRELVNKFESAGNKTVRWNGKDEAGHLVSSGVYLYQIQAGSFVKTRKMIFVK